MNIYDFLTVNNAVNRLPEQTKKIVLDKFIKQFVDMQLVSKYILYWNSIKDEYKESKTSLSLEKLNIMEIRYLDNLYIYLERDRELFKGNIQVVLDFLEQQEPWEDTDIIVFDESYDWLIAFTHEDEIIFIE